MKASRRLLIGLGILLAAMLVLLAWVGISSRQFRLRETPFVAQFVQDLSRRWEVSDVAARVDARFVAQVASADGQRLLNDLKHLGALRGTADQKLARFVFNPAGSMGIFSFAGSFANGDAVVSVSIVEKADAVHVRGISISGVRWHSGAP